MAEVEAPELNVLADSLLETAVLHFNQEAVVFIETSDGDLELKDVYQDLRCSIYDILDEQLNVGQDNYRCAVCGGYHNPAVDLGCDTSDYTDPER